MPTNNELVLIRSQLLTDIANAIRAKTGSNEGIYPADMDTEIASISTGITPSGSISISNNGSHDVTNYATAVVSINTEAHPPITVNITQSEHQTIKVTPSKSFSSLYSSGNISCPASILLTATVTPDAGYQAGTLNQSSISNAQWGNTYNFSATAATEIPMITVNLKVQWALDDDNANNTRGPVTIRVINTDYSYDEIFTLTASNNWTVSTSLKASTTYQVTGSGVPNYTRSNRSSFTTSSTNNQTISLYIYTYIGLDDFETPL